MMNRLSVVALVLGLFMATRAVAWEPNIHKGTVVSASDSRLVLKDKAGKEHSYTIDGMTNVTVNGKPGRLEDLMETMPVQVTSDEKGKVIAVATIDKDKDRIVLVFDS
jgi:hypothetical protein